MIIGLLVHLPSYEVVKVKSGLVLSIYTLLDTSDDLLPVVYVNEPLLLSLALSNVHAVIVVIPSAVILNEVFEPDTQVSPFVVAPLSL